LFSHEDIGAFLHREKGVDFWFLSEPESVRKINSPIPLNYTAGMQQIN
jgi:hypothetical protein